MRRASSASSTSPWRCCARRASSGWNGSRPRPVGARAIFLFAGLSALLLIFYQAAFAGNGPVLKLLLTRDWLAYGLAQAGRAWPFFGLACLAIGIGSAPRAWLALAVVAADMLAFAVGVNVGVPARLLFPPTPETRFVSAHLGRARVLWLGDGIPGDDRSRLIPNGAMALGWRDVLGYDPLLSARYEQLLRALALGTDGTEAASAVPGLGGVTNGRVLERLGVRYLIAPRRLSCPGYRLALAGDVNVYQDDAARLAWLAARSQVVPDEAEVRRRVVAGLIADDAVLLNAPPPRPVAPASAAGRLRVSSASPGEETILARLPGNGSAGD